MKKSLEVMGGFDNGFIEDTAEGRGGEKEVDGGSMAGSGADGDLPPSNIMHAAYVGAIELVKSMAKVSWRVFCFFTERGRGRVGQSRAICSYCIFRL